MAEIERVQALTSDVWVSPGDDSPRVYSLMLGKTELAMYSQKSPDKESDNEDTAFVCAYSDDTVILGVADGAGGMPSGRRASRTAAKTLGKSLIQSRENGLLLRTAILNAMEYANQEIIDTTNGAATTLSLVAIDGRSLRSYHVGDSATLVSGQRGLLKFQTIAHSPVGFAVEAGFLDEREAMHHAARNIVSNFLGTAEMRIEISAELQLAARDTVLLASDGLTDNLHVDEIVERIRKGRLQDGMRKLIDLANWRMINTESSQPSKADDLTMVLLRKLP